MTQSSGPAGRVAIITGAADGIGWATAQRLAQDCEHVVLVDLKAESAKARAAELGPSHWWYEADVGAEAQVVAMVGAVQARFGRIDILVNNAGVGEQPEMTLEQTVAAFDRILGVHLRGTFLVSREVGRVFVSQQRGAIVNISSIAGWGGHPGRNAYGAAKAGISAMTAAMASEWARDGIRINAVAPGFVKTDLVIELVRKGSLNLDNIEARTPMGRTGTPQEIAEAIAFLASDRASFITGTTLAVDGGWLAFGAPQAKLVPVQKKAT